MFRIHPLKLADGSLVADLESDFRLSMSCLAREASLESLIRFLYVIINKIVEILVNPPVIEGQAGH